MKLGIGIDTGGTYTDVIVYDFDTRTILQSNKALTTKEDLSIGITNALNKLNRQHLCNAGLISLSTTLATNACVENKGGRAKLLFLGLEQSLFEKFGTEYGFSDEQEVFHLDCDTRLNGDIITPPDFELLKQNCKEWFLDAKAVAIVELNAMNNNGILEKQAKKIIKEQYNIPIICGCELYSDLNSIKRGVTALLNARLIAVIEDFFKAINLSLKKNNVTAPVVVVRSDGSLMSKRFAKTRPVETLLCGPAASVMGGASLTTGKDCVVVDMGGTTTDIALIKDGIPVRVTDGINIGNWKTFVKGLFVDTFSLGGDSGIGFLNREIYLQKERLVPLCVLAERYPNITEKLKNLAKNHQSGHTRPLHEFYMLLKDISKNQSYTKKERDFCELIKNNPLPIREAAEKMGSSIYTFEVSRLEKEGIVIRSGLTPTDIMHIKGDFAKYDATPSKYAAKFVANSTDQTVKTLCDSIYITIKKKLYYNIVRILMCHSNQNLNASGIDALSKTFIEESYFSKNEFVSFNIQTKAQLIGIGAPIHIFLKDVAKALGAKCLVPAHASVANALGAVVGNVFAEEKIEIKPVYNAGGIDGFEVVCGNRNKIFKELDGAITHAKKEGEKKARNGAISRGAHGDISVSFKVEEKDAHLNGGHIFLGCTVIATALGRIDF